MNDVEINPVKYGVLWQKVQSMEKDLDEIKTDIKDLNRQIGQLVELANRSRGALWVVMSIVGTGTAVVALVIKFVKG